MGTAQSSVVMFSVTLYLVSLVPVLTSDPIGCFTEDQTWTNEDVTDIVPGVTGAYYCQESCAAEDTCAYFTWFTANHAHTPLFCVKFHTAATEVPCENCVSGPASCYCSAPVGCHVMGDNIVDVTPGITEELVCQAMCKEAEPCVYYTWYDETNVLAHTCILFSSCDVMDESCEGCFSGPPDCSDVPHPTASSSTATVTSTAATTHTTHTTTSTTKTTVTTTTSITTSPSRCGGYEYNELSEADRNMNFNDGEGGIDYCDQEHPGLGMSSSPSWKGEAWYRFVGEAGSRMPEMDLPSMNSCGTHWPGWVADEHPTVEEGEKDVRICFYNVGNACNEEVTAKIVNCGDFFLYKLPETPICNSRYCGAH